jgi:predicted O-methyltransferase YrrM
MPPESRRRARRTGAKGARRGQPRRRVLARAAVLGGLVGLVAGVAVGAVVWIAAALGLTDPDAVVPAALVTAGAVAATFFEVRRRSVPKGSIRRMRARITRLETLVQERSDQLAAMIQLVPYNDPYPLPFGGWAMTPDAVTALLRETQLVGADGALELGSGLSTLVLARYFHERGKGIVVALEADPGWATQTRRQLAAMGLEAQALVLDAPLVETHVGTETYRWYRLDDEARRHAPYDVLLVDGPPQRTDPTGSPRYPALPLLEGWLSPRAVVIVDDTKRAGEASMLERWQRESPGWGRRDVRTQKGMAVLTRSEPR